jgi:hypothetical protein
MVTQTLFGIGETPPFHWRGERQRLSDFNPAFAALLGGAPLDEAPGGDFEAFEAFVLSLAAPANPREDRRRTLSDASAIAPPPGFPAGSPARGQAHFLDPAGADCVRCHTLPTGTSNDTIADARFDPLPERTHFEVAHFKELWRKEQGTVAVQLADGSWLDYPTLGSGLGHAGASNSLFDFVGDLFDVDDQAASDIVAFVGQIDQGLAPLVHAAERLAAATQPAARDELDLFVSQALARHIDIAVYGRIDLGAGERELAWSWNRADGLFHAEDSAVAARSPAFFIAQAQAGLADMVFVGLPVGMGRPFAVDLDDDGLANLDEARHGTAPSVADGDGDGFPDGYEVAMGSDPTLASSLPSDAVPPSITGLKLQWITARVAKLAWETDEPTRFRIDYGTSFGPGASVSGERAKSVHTAILSDLLPSTEATGTLFTYSGTLTAFDLAGNAAATPLPDGMTTGFFHGTSNVVLGELEVESAVALPGASLAVSVRSRVDAKTGGPPALPAPRHVVIATVHVNGVRSASFTSPNPTSFTVGGQPPALPGPFVLSLPSDLAGITALAFTQGGLLPGDTLRLNIEAVIPVPPGYQAQSPDFTLVNSLGRWDPSATPAALRGVELSY